MAFCIASAYQLNTIYATVQYVFVLHTTNKL